MWQVADYQAVASKPFDHGQFGTVWRASRLSDGRAVALKLVLRANGRDQIDAERHGAILQQQFHRVHGMVPEIYDYGQDGDDFYIAMELIEGGKLADQIASGPLPPQAAAEHAAWLCGFLDKAHRFATTIEGNPYVAIVHADLKPQHVLFTTSGEKRILDFGIAKALARTTRVTTDNWCTTPYASPERLLTGRVDAHVDLWSLGVMLYEMVVGHRLYPHLEASQSRSQLEHAITTNAPRDSPPRGCPPPLAAIISKLLAPQIERRYSDAAAIKSDLDLFLAGRDPAAIEEYVTVATVRREGDIRNSEFGIWKARLNANASRSSSTGAIPNGNAAIANPGSAMRNWPPRAISGSSGGSIPNSRFQIPNSMVPPTDPLPLPAPAAAAVAVAVPPAATVTARVRRLGFRRAASVVAAATMVALIATEGVAWVAAERFRAGVAALDSRSLPHLHTGYRAIRALSFFGLGLRVRVDRLLENRLTTLADTVIADYRREEPTLGAADWQQAQNAMQWALELSPRDRTLRARELTCEAHVARHAARSQPRGSAVRQMYQSAIDKFRAAAELDPSSYDPYLGITRIAVYGLDDVDQAAAAIGEAEKRGYTSGRRERAQLGDGYLRRADRKRRVARSLSGDRHTSELQESRADYERCVESFDQIVGFARAADNLAYCRHQIDRIDTELNPDPEKLDL
jgi:eukaryotic-like serine/threonine-protein kinase